MVAVLLQKKGYQFPGSKTTSKQYDFIDKYTTTLNKVDWRESEFRQSAPVPVQNGHALPLCVVLSNLKVNL